MAYQSVHSVITQHNYITEYNQRKKNAIEIKNTLYTIRTIHRLTGNSQMTEIKNYVQLHRLIIQLIYKGLISTMYSVKENKTLYDSKPARTAAKQGNS